MKSGETIRANVELPCSVRLSGSELQIARGITEEITRESVVVVMSSVAAGNWLKASANVSIAVELPFTGAVEPRVLECLATISRVRTSGKGVRIVATIDRMMVISRDPEAQIRLRSAAHRCASGSVSAIERSLNVNPVIRTNHRTKLKSELTGERTMKFLKNFFAEEDGQDMVEYGLVISLVVVGGVVAYQTFSNTLGTNLNTVFGKVENAL
jgi:Flp pilus assembly pilin Flp